MKPVEDDSDATASLDELAAELTVKQRLWAEAMAGEAAGNGTKACKLAGYKGTESALACQAFRNARNANVRAFLSCLTESDPLVCGRVERLRLLSDIARGKTFEERVNKDGDAFPVPPSIRDRIAAIDALSKASGEHLPKAPGEGSDPLLVLMAGATVAQILELANSGRK